MQTDQDKLDKTPEGYTDPVDYLRRFIPPMRRPQSMPADEAMNNATNWPAEEE